MTEIKGNITFVSNLYPVEKDILREDINYCQHIEDPKRIFELKCNPFFKWFNFTKKQESIFRVQSGSNCKIDRNKKLFGAIISSDGLIKVVCKCDKADCKYFSECTNL